jgi:hypothetical protein
MAGQTGPAGLAAQVGGADGSADGQDLQRGAGPELRGRILQGRGEVAGGDRPVRLAGLVDQHQGDPGDQEQPGRRDQRRANDGVQHVPTGWRRGWLRDPLLLQPVLVVLHTPLLLALGRRPGSTLVIGSTRGSALTIASGHGRSPGLAPAGGVLRPK